MSFFIFSYLICEGALASKDVVYEYLFNINDTLNDTFRNDDSEFDVESIVPLSILKSDKNFFNYIYNSNEKYAV